LCSALAWLVGGAGGVGDWLWAASSALMVAGDICENPVDPAVAAELPEAGAPLARPNRSAEAWLKPVDCVGDEADEVNDWMASSALDAAPRANSMAELQQTPQSAAPTLRAIDQQTPCHREKPNKMMAFCVQDGAEPSAIDAANGRIFRPRRPALPPALARV